MSYLENEQIGERLRIVRKKKHYDYQMMGEILGISEGHYRKIERGVYGLDVRKVLILYARLGVDPMYLLLGQDDLDVRYNLEAETTNRYSVVCELLDYCKNQLADDPDDTKPENTIPVEI